MNWKAVKVQRWSYFARDLDHVESVFDEYENASNVLVVLLISSATAKINQVVAGYEILWVTNMNLRYPLI